MTDIERELSGLASKLKEYRVDDHGLSYCGRGLKLNSEEDGTFNSLPFPKLRRYLSLAI